MITLNVVTIMRRICEGVESVLDYGFTDLNMRLRAVCTNTNLDSECELILVLTETDHTVLLIDRYWLQAAMLVMSSSETTVRQLLCERSDETLVFAAFLCADSVIQGSHRSCEVCGFGEHWNETTWQTIQRQPEM